MKLFMSLTRNALERLTQQLQKRITFCTVMLIWLAAFCIVAPARAEGAEREKMTRLFVHAWLPEAGTLEVEADSSDARLLEVAELTRHGRFVLAERMLETLGLTKTDKRTAYLVFLFRLQVAQRRYRMVGDVRISRGETQLDRVKTGLLAQTLIQQMNMLSSEMQGDDKVDAATALQYSNAMDSCLYEIPALIRSNKITQVFNRDVLEDGNPSMASDAQCLDIVHMANLAANRASLLGKLQQQLLLLLVKGAFAVANQDFKSAKSIYENAVTLAEGEANYPAAAAFMLRSGDVMTAPYGDVMSFGYNLVAENIGIRNMLLLGALPDVVKPILSPQLSAAENWFNRADEVSHRGVNTDLSFQLTLRRAHLARLRGSLDPCIKLYGEAAEIARSRGWIREAAIAQASVTLLSVLVSGSDDPIADSSRNMEQLMGSLVENGDMGGMLSIVELTNSWATRIWTFDRDLLKSARVLRQTITALEKHNQRHATVDLLLTLAIVYAGSGRAEKAIQVLQQAIIRQESYIEKANSLNKEYESKRLQLGTDPAHVSSEILLAGLLVSRVAGIISMKFQEERTVFWKNQLDIVDQKANALAAQVGTAIPFLTEQMRQLIEDRRAAQRISSFESEVLRDFKSRLTCQGVLQVYHKYRPRANEWNSPLKTIGFDLFAARCNPDLFESPRAELRKVDPVASFKRALTARNESQTTTSAIQASNSLQELTTYFTFALAAQSFDQMDRWLSEFDELLQDYPKDPALVPLAQGYRALTLLGEKEYERAQHVLNDLIANKSNAWFARSLPFRIETFTNLVEAEAALGHGPESLLAFEQMRFEQEKWQRQKTGVNTSSRSSAELAMLERLAATGGGLTDDQLNHLTRLQAEAERELPDDQRLPSMKMLSDTLQAMPKGTVTLVYHAGPRFITLWCLRTGQPIIVRRLESPAEDTMRLVVQFERSLSGGGGNNEWEALSAELYKRLIVPANLNGKDSELIFLIQGKLSLIPFEVLGPDKSHLLLTSHPVAYISRLTGASVSRDSTVNRSDTALVVGLSQDLENAAGEAKQVGRLLGGTLLVEKNATYENIRRHIKSARWIHFATHGGLNRTNPYLSYLDLYGNERIEAWQLIRDIPQAELVSLSACDTKQEAQDLSDISSAAGDSNSMAAFAFAGGAKWVLASLWQAEDEKTKFLMIDFYRRLKSEQLDPAAALQITKLQMLRKGLHPALYSQFLLSTHDLTSWR
jgi:CHAT domain-containing protein